MTDQEEIERARQHLEIIAAIDDGLGEVPDLLVVVAESVDHQAAVGALMGRYGWTEIGARALLDMQFWRVTEVERRKIREQREALERLVEGSG